VSILNQDYHDIELIVVDNHSTDTTREQVKPFVDRLLVGGPERTTQANSGVYEAKGELIYLTGSDMTRDYEFIEECVKKIKEGYDAVYMSVKTDMDVTHFWGRVKALERESYIGTEKESARFFKKKVWEELNGFDENMIAMEEDFQHRLDLKGYKTGRIHAREYHLHEDDTLKKVFQKAFYYGKFQKKYLKKHKGRGLRKLTFINLKVFTLHPILFMGFVVYKLTQLGGLICSYVIR
jgi:glycosyltransferase involved in cell wall biosynthesis